jgi:phytoene desaturase
MPSYSDESVAPPGYENLFILIPISTELRNDSEEVRNKYLHMVLSRLNQLKGIDIKDNIIFKKSFCISDFKNEYNAFKGNAYGLANTLKQTAILKPKIKSEHINNLYFTGQLTLPGPGMPPSIISGQMVANLILKNDEKNG